MSAAVYLPGAGGLASFWRPVAELLRAPGRAGRTCMAANINGGRLQLANATSATATEARTTTPTTSPTTSRPENLRCPHEAPVEDAEDDPCPQSRMPYLLASRVPTQGASGRAAEPGLCVVKRIHRDIAVRESTLARIHN